MEWHKGSLTRPKLSGALQVNQKSFNISSFSVSPPAQEVPSRPDLSSSKKKKGLAKGLKLFGKQIVNNVINHPDKRREVDDERGHHRLYQP